MIRYRNAALHTPIGKAGRVSNPKDTVYYEYDFFGHIYKGLETGVNNYVHTYADLMNVTPKNAYSMLRRDWQLRRFAFELYQDGDAVNSPSKGGHNFPKFVKLR